jgi:hypothetical protein
VGPVWRGGKGAHCVSGGYCSVHGTMEEKKGALDVGPCATKKKWERHLELELSIESALSERGRAASMQQCRLNNHLPSRGVARTDW